MSSNKIENLRRKARKKLPLLLTKQDNKCYYCGKQLINKRNLNVLKLNCNTVTYLENKHIKTAMYATIDHKISFGLGLKNGYSVTFLNSLENLVASCWICNHLKERKSRKVRNVCNLCGASKANDKHRKCVGCRFGLSYKASSIVIICPQINIKVYKGWAILQKDRTEKLIHKVHKYFGQTI